MIRDSGWILIGWTKRGEGQGFLVGGQVIYDTEVR